MRNRDRFRKTFYGIRIKLLLYVVGLIALALTLVAVGIGQIVSHEVKNSAKDNYSYATEQFYHSFEGVYEKIDGVMANCITSPMLQKSLKNREMNAYDSRLLTEALSFSNMPDQKYYLYIDNKGNLYSQKKVLLDQTKFPNSELCQGLGNAYSKTRFIWTRDSIFGSGAMGLFAGRYVQPMDRSYEPGYLYFLLNDSVYEDMTAELKDTKAMYFLIDNSGQILYQKNGESYRWGIQEKEHLTEAQNLAVSQNRAVSQNLEPSKEDANTTQMNQRQSDNQQADNTQVDTQQADTQQVDHAQANHTQTESVRIRTTKEGLVFTKLHSASGYTMLTYVPKAVINQSVYDSMYVIGIVFLVVFAAALLLCIYFAKSFTKPITYISTLMENFDDTNFAQIVELDTNTELDHIGQAYNKMLGRIENLIGEVRYKEKELRKAELDTLLYQIQPHFLYNTLDTVYMLARISKEATIMKMIQSLSRFLRINLSNGAEEIPISKELLHVQSYLDIQKIRNSDLFEYTIECEESLKDLPVMKMILQPLAENCIKHGFANIDEMGHIGIRVIEEGEEIVFAVENNGTCMAESVCRNMNRLEQIPLEQISSITVREDGGYGIGNVVKRLRMRYPDQVHFYYVVSAAATTCLIRIQKGAIHAAISKTEHVPSNESLR